MDDAQRAQELADIRKLAEYYFTPIHNCLLDMAADVMEKYRAMQASKDKDTDKVRRLGTFLKSVHDLTGVVLRKHTERVFKGASFEPVIDSEGVHESLSVSDLDVIVKQLGPYGAEVLRGNLKKCQKS